MDNRKTTLVNSEVAVTSVLGPPQLDALTTILKRYGVTSLEVFEELYDQPYLPLYRDLLDYYLTSGDMPYETAKARSGMDPHEWVYQQVTEEMKGEWGDVLPDAATYIETLEASMVSMEEELRELEAELKAFAKGGCG